ncbi:hypothetical protein HW49_08660 [Porphyromonadaceae bacterium COT-184 OH4590]|nr:hypothetical protein HW49_08660 [Porphyromonadaceae bacterium COT-184 OH4590]
MASVGHRCLFRFFEDFFLLFICKIIKKILISLFSDTFWLKKCNDLNLAIDVDSNSLDVNLLHVG